MIRTIRRRFDKEDVSPFRKDLYIVTLCRKFTVCTDFWEKTKRALSQLAAAIHQLSDENPDHGQDQYVQKRRRHTEPGWKDLHGKNPKK
jgi:hypothetical protein